MFCKHLFNLQEAEKHELERFLTAINQCKWTFWSSECEVPPPDPLVFLKHMNPLKIGIRILTTLISEPMLIISDNIKTMIHGITGKYHKVLIIYILCFIFIFILFILYFI